MRCPSAALLVATLLFPTQTLVGQSTLEISGRILDADTGEPITHAKVNVSYIRQQNTPADSTQAVIRTDASGTFRILNAPAGSYSLSCERSGYISQSRINRQSSTHVVLRTESVGSVTLYLGRQSVVEGVVSDERGRRIVGSVRALRLTIKDGKYTPMETAGSSIDETGRFRIPELQPGRYHFVFVPNRYNRILESRTYQTVVYPGVSHIDQAQILDLKPGQVEQANFHLTSEPAYSVRGKLNGADTRASTEIRFLRTTGMPIADHFGGSWNTTDFSFSHDGLPAGEYLIAANWPSGPIRMHSERTVTVSGRDVEGIILDPLPLPALQGKLQFDTPSDPQRPVSLPGVQLVSDSGSQHHIPVKQDGTFVMDGMLPGHYTLHAEPYQERFVRSVRQGGRDVLKDGLVLSQDGITQPLDIVVGSGTSTINATLDADIPDSASQVRLVAFRKTTHGLFLQLQSVFGNLNGSTSFSRNYGLQTARYAADSKRRTQAAGLVPGDYVVFAWTLESGELSQLPYNTQEFFTRYGSFGEPLTIAESGKASITIHRLLPKESFE